MEPIGAPRPFDSETATRSNGSANCAAVWWPAAAALKSRAPSRKLAMPRSRAAAPIRTDSSSGKTMPPLRLCVFSTSTSVVGG